MLDPFSALGLAGNIVQFVDFGSKLVFESIDIYKSLDGSLPRNVELGSIVEDLSLVAGNLGSTSETGNRISKDERALIKLSDQCKDVADKLLAVLQGLAVSGRHKKWKSVRQALRTVWRDDEIQALQKRLNDFRSQLTLRLVAILSDQQSNAVATLKDLSHAHSIMDVKSTNALSDLKDDLLKISTEMKKNQASSEGLFEKITELMSQGGKLATEQAILQSLRFKTMKTRHSNIVEAHTKTFDWIFEDASSNGSPTLEFRQWLRHDGGLYWIAGKAGSGKSTLMKYLSDHGLVKTLLEGWAGSKSLFTGSYFFWSAGNEMQKSQQGLLQSLLHDILRQCPALIPIVCASRWSADAMHQEDMTRFWTRTELLEAFGLLTKQQALPVKLCFFVDGLDEYDGDPVEIADILKGFARSSDIKVCLSSRPWTELEDALSGDPARKLMLQDYTREDIKRYIHDLLEEDPRYRKVVTEDAGFRDLSFEILEKAQGVFLWVFLAVRSLLRGFPHADTLSDLQKRLRHIPPTLESYFIQMLDTIEDVYHDETAQILNMCLANDGPVNLMTFSFLEEKDQNYALRYKISPWTRDEIRQRNDIVRKRVKVRCRDLIEISNVTVFNWGSTLQNSSDLVMVPTVDFLHRTVRDFFLSSKMQSKLASWMTGSFNAHHSLCRSFLAQMKIAPAEHKSLGRNLQGPFIDLITDFLYQARETETRYSITDIALIDEVDRVAAIVLDVLQPGTTIRLKSSKSPLGLRILDHRYPKGWIVMMAAQAGLKIYISEKLKGQPTLVKAAQWRSLLYSALLLPMESGWATDIDLDMLQLLLERKADPNQGYQDTTVWSAFLRNCHQQSQYTSPDTRQIWADAIQMLLEHGADPNAKFETGKSSEKPTFSGRTLRYPIYSTLDDIVDGCCPRDASHLRDVIERKRGFSLWKLIGWK